MSDRIQGRAQEVKGKATGDSGKELEGRARQKAGELKDSIRRRTRDLQEKAGDATRHPDEPPRPGA